MAPLYTATVAPFYSAVDTSASAVIISFNASMPARRQKRSMLMRRSSKASGIDGEGRQEGFEESSLRVVLVMASFSLMESTPRA